MKKIVLFLFTLATSTQLISQDFELPHDYAFKSPEDYAKYEPDVINAVNWLIETPVKKKEAKRKEVNQFIVMYLTGSPNVSVEISEEVVTFMDCVDCFMVFMGGWAKYALENDYSSDKVKGNLAGVESVIEFYELNKKALGKNIEIQKYLKLKKKGKLENHIVGKLTK